MPTEPWYDRPQAQVPSEPTPLEYLHRYWHHVAPEDRLRFLTEMLTPHERRAIQRGFDDEEEHAYGHERVD